MTSRARLSALSQASACSSGIRNAQSRSDFSFPFSCARSDVTISVELWKRRRSSGSTYIFHSLQSSCCLGSTGALKIRCSSAGTPSGLVLAGICRNNSARNGSRSEICNASFSRQMSMASADFFERREQQITMKLLHVKLAALPHPAPQDRTTILMDLEHVALSFPALLTKHTMKNHRHRSQDN